MSAGPPLHRVHQADVAPSDREGSRAILQQSYSSSTLLLALATLRQVLTP